MARSQRIQRLSHFLLFLLAAPAIVSCMTSLDENIWTPDDIEKKADPFEYIDGTWQGPYSNYNFNADQFQLMNRSAATCNGCTDDGLHVVVENLKLFVKDKEYWIKGMCYNPVPLGAQFVNPTTGYLDARGGGLCSIKETPFGEYKSACFDSDFFDGSMAAEGAVPPGPENGWFYDIWNRDFPIMKAMGVNTLRLYNANPLTRMYTEAIARGDEFNHFNLTRPLGKSHIEFMDFCEMNDFMVIFPLVGDENILKQYTIDQVKLLVQAQIDEIGDHNALLMWNVGNELNLMGDLDIRNKIIELMNFARNYTFTKHGRKIPITHAVVDNPDEYDVLVPLLPVDVFSTNAGYRGLNFQDLWSGNAAKKFSGFKKLSNDTGKPVFIAEIGWHQINGTETASPKNHGWFNSVWRDLIAHNMEGAIGGAYFEYSDEPLKSDPKQQTMGAVKFVPKKVNDDPSPLDSTWGGATGTKTNTGGNTGSNGSTRGTATEVTVPEEEGAASQQAVAITLIVSAMLALLL